MKKFKFIFVILLFVSIFLSFNLFCYNLEANSLNDLGNGYDSTKVTTGSDTNGVQKIKQPINKVFGVLFTILQVGAVGGVIFAGVSYMFASAENKADLKRKLLPLVIGMIIVFGASTVVDFITKSFINLT